MSTSITCHAHLCLRARKLTMKYREAMKTKARKFVCAAQLIGHLAHADGFADYRGTRSAVSLAQSGTTA